MLGSGDIAVMVPYWGGVDHQHLACMRKVTASGILTVNTQNIPYIDMARGLLIKETMDQSNAKILVFIDHDILFDVNDVFSLATNCIAGPYAVLAGVYAKRKPNEGIVGLPVGTDEITFYTEGLFEARFVGLGFTAIRREVFEKLNETIKDYECPTVGKRIRPYFRHVIEEETDHYLGEDVSFCRRVNAAGFKIGVDAKPRLLHRGSYDYALEDSGNSIPLCDTLKITMVNRKDI